MSWASLDHLFTDYILDTSFVTWSDEQTHHKLFNIGRFLSFHVILGFHSFGELLYFGIDTWMIFLVAYQPFFFSAASLVFEPLVSAEKKYRCGPPPSNTHHQDDDLHF